MQPAFHRQNIASFGTIMTGEAEATLGRWRQAAAPFIEVEQEMMNLAMNVVGKALFSEETMRLYPPGWGISRQTIEADHLGVYAIPAHTAVFLNVYGMHRHSGYWENPDQFEPERFTPERVAARPRFAYLPLGGGPRQCIGNLFAMTIYRPHPLWIR
ncbi:MAG: cytochrome P450 [Chloroflexota bacterium]